jgi:hypothetical protein
MPCHSSCVRCVHGRCAWATAVRNAASRDLHGPLCARTFLTTSFLALGAATFFSLTSLGMVLVSAQGEQGEAVSAVENLSRAGGAAAHGGQEQRREQQQLTWWEGLRDRGGMPGGRALGEK